MQQKKLTKNEVKYLAKSEWDDLSPRERKLIEIVLDQLDETPDANQEIRDRRTFGEKTADVIATFGGSWTFIIIFFSFLFLWTVLNTEILGPKSEAFDPYPYVFLNLILSMLAAIQAPIIMMSQNRQSARDRIDNEVDHEVNVRAELAIRNIQQRIEGVEQKLEVFANKD